MNKIILYIATSLDGFIADINGGVDWLPHPVEDPEDIFGYKSLMSCIDTILMGSRSYKQILSFGDWGWPDKQTYVFTSGQLETDKPYIGITHDNPFEFMTKLKDRKSDRDIWLLGGAQVAQSFAQEEIILTIISQTLGKGIPLGLIFNKFDLTAAKAYDKKIYLRKNT